MRDSNISAMVPNLLAHQRRMHRTAIFVDVFTVGVIAIDDDVCAQFAQDAGGRFVSGAVGAIDHHAHPFEGHAARERSFGIFNVTAESILDAHGLADFIGGGTDVFDAATEDEVFDLMLDLG